MTGAPIALVTGAASGIGLATADRLCRDGFDLVLVDIDEQVKVVAKELRQHGRRCLAVEHDLANQNPFSPVVERARDELGEIDVLVNNAGRGIAADTPSTSRFDWDLTIAVNLTAAFETCRAVLPSMIERGAGVVINISSVAGIVGLPRRAAYCASKAGLIGLTRAIAADHATDGVRANAVCPGTVETGWVARIIEDEPDPVAARAQMEKRQLNGRLGRPEEIAGAVAYLASPQAAFVNGSCLVIDGGMTAI